MLQVTLVVSGGGVRILGFPTSLSYSVFVFSFSYFSFLCRALA